MKQKKSLLIIAILLVLVSGLFFTRKYSRENESILSGYTFLKTPVSDSLIVGKLEVDGVFINEPCRNVQKVRSWNAIKSIREFGDTAQFNMKIRKALEDAIGFSNSGNKIQSIDSVVIYQAEDYSQFSLPPRGNVVVSAAVAVTKFTVETNEAMKAGAAAEDIKKKLAGVKTNIKDGLVDVRSGTGLVVAVKCIEITDMSSVSQAIAWSQNHAEAIDTFYKVNNYFLFGPVDTSDLVPIKSLNSSNRYVKLVFSSGVFTSAGKAKTGSIIFSPAKSEVDTASSGYSQGYRPDPGFLCKTPHRVLGETTGTEILIYEVVINYALIYFEKFHTTGATINRLAGVDCCDLNSAGELTLISKRWKFRLK